MSRVVHSDTFAYVDASPAGRAYASPYGNLVYNTDDALDGAAIEMDGVRAVSTDSVAYGGFFAALGFGIANAYASKDTPFACPPICSFSLTLANVGTNTAEVNAGGPAFATSDGSILARVFTGLDNDTGDRGTFEAYLSRRFGLMVTVTAPGASPVVYRMVPPAYGTAVALRLALTPTRFDVYVNGALAGSVPRPDTAQLTGSGYKVLGCAFRTFNDAVAMYHTSMQLVDDSTYVVLNKFWTGFSKTEER